MGRGDYSKKVLGTANSDPDPNKEALIDNGIYLSVSGSKIVL